MKDTEIIAFIRQGSREKAIRFLYKEFPKVKANIISSGGDKEIAEEIFHDALILFVEKVSQPTFELTSKASTYLFGIARLLFKNELRKRQKSHDLEWADTMIVSEQELGYDIQKEERLLILDQVLTSLNKKCQEMFQRFYFKKESMEQIAKAFGFSSVNSAKTQKYKCMEQAIKLASNLQPKNEMS